MTQQHQINSSEKLLPGHKKYRCEEMQKVLHVARRTVAVAATVDTL